MIFIYVHEIQDEALMHNKQQWKREKRTCISSPTSSYTKYCREEKSPEREIQKGSSVAYIYGYIPIGGDIIFP
jgi:hypothetical protein